MYTNIIFILFLLLGGSYLVYISLKRITSKSHFVKGEGMSDTDVDQKYKNIPEIDRFTERYLRPFGWLFLGIAFVIISILLLIK